MKILIGTGNPGKIEAAKEAFLEYYENIEVIGINVKSEVPDQPVNEQIYKGAINRVKNLKEYAKEQKMEVDFYVAVESGITNQLGKWMITNIAAIEDKNGKESWGASPAYPVPERYVEEIISSDLQNVMDKIFNENKIGQKRGGISKLTKGKISRPELNKLAFMMSLTQYINEEKW